MVEIVLPVHHRVLIGAEFLDPLGKEGFGGFLCLFAGDGPGKVVERSEMVTEAILHQFDDFTG